MPTPLVVRAAAAGGLTLCLAVASPAAANAQVNIWKECGTRFQAAKAANELNGQSWQEFLKACRVGAAAPAIPEPSVSATPAPPVASSNAALPPAPAATVASPPAPAISESGTASAPAAPTTTRRSDAAPSKLASEGVVGEKLREKKCAAQWKAQKTELKKTNPTLKWSQYWTECNERLKMSTH
jgi:hypothetical protein